MTDLWEFKYEPNKLEDMILSDTIRKRLEKAIVELPNLMLYGTPGIGKGTFTKILLEESGCDYIWLNASDETGIDAMREKVRSFATALGVTKIKIVVLNEGDSLTSGQQGSQKMLRQLMEDVHKITRFILLANYEHSIIPELKSRFRTLKLEGPPAKDIFHHMAKILKAEGVKYNKKTLLELVKKCYPDIRSTIGVLQENSIGGVLSGDLISSSENLNKDIMRFILAGDLEAVRKTLRSNYIDYSSVYEYLYNNAGSFKSPGDAILEVGQHLVWDSTIAIKEINFMHMVVSMMKNGAI